MQRPVEPFKVFVNIYWPPLIGAMGAVYHSRELADQMAGRNRIACKEVKIEPGEGISDRR